MKDENYLEMRVKQTLKPGTGKRKELVFRSGGIKHLPRGARASRPSVTVARRVGRTRVARVLHFLSLAGLRIISRVWRHRRWQGGVLLRRHVFIGRGGRERVE